MARINNEKELFEELSCNELCALGKIKKKREDIEDEIHDKSCGCW